MKRYLVFLQDDKGNAFDNKEFYSVFNKKDFRKYLINKLKNEGYGKIKYLKIEESESV